MKKLISHIILGLLMLFIVSCMPQNEVGTPFHKGKEVTLRASMPYNNSGGGIADIPDRQRVSGLDSHPMTSQGAINLYWSEGDEIAVVVGEEEATFTLVSGAGTSNATFEGEMPASGSSYEVHYPIDYHDSLLAKQSYVENGFGDGLMKMSTRDPGTLDDGFTLYADNALLGLQFAGDAVVSKIVLTNVETQATYILDCSKQVVSTAGGRLFYIVVPAGKWDKGMQVDVYNAGGILIESRVKDETMEFVAGEAIMMAELEMDDIIYKDIEVNGVTFRMILVEGGGFKMGADNEKHHVRLSDYYICQTEVTRALWYEVMGGEKPTAENANRPIGYVTYANCRDFISKLNELKNLHFRLPTNAEWEFAAKGGKRSKDYRYSGSDVITEIGWTLANSDEKIHPVAQLKANELCLYDMTGNAWEWVYDKYGNYPKDSVINPIGPESGTVGTLRGGSYHTSATRCENTYRSSRGLDNSDVHISFRLVLDLHDYVDLGLPSGTLWATCNVGAEVAEEYGKYYAWGETEEKENYSWANYKWCKGTEKTLTKYCNDSQYGANGFKDGLTTLLPEDDAAHVHWGGIWRMPTGEEQEELIKNCNWGWTNTNGVMGYKVTSQINGNQIFIPAAGYKNGNQYNSRETGNDAWGSTLTQSGTTSAQCINFVWKNERIVGTYFQRYYGFSIRPVCEP